MLFVRIPLIAVFIAYDLVPQSRDFRILKMPVKTSISKYLPVRI